MFRPNTDPYNSASFGETALDTLIDRGEQVARKQWDEILALKKKIGLSDSSDMHRKRLVHSYPVAPTDTFHIRRVLFEGIDVNTRYLKVAFEADTPVYMDELFVNPVIR